MLRCLLDLDSSFAAISHWWVDTCLETRAKSGQQSMGRVDNSQHSHASKGARNKGTHLLLFVSSSQRHNLLALPPHDFLFSCGCQHCDIGDGRNPAPPKKPGMIIPDSSVNANKQWFQPLFPSFAKWISSIHGIKDMELSNLWRRVA